MFCLHCRRLWPSEARFCGHCGRSFGGRYCQKGHRSPPSAHRCVLCGDVRLTLHTAYVSLGWLYCGLSSGCLMLLVLILGVALLLALRAASTGVAGVLGRALRGAEAVLIAVVPPLVLIALLLSALPESVGRPVRRLALGFVYLLSEVLIVGMRTLFVGLRRRR